MAAQDIILTTDHEQQKKLRRKLSEYGERMANRHPRDKPHTAYKASILQALLQYGRISSGAVSEQFMREAWFVQKVYDDAFAVIRAYNDGNLGLLGGTGTGLK